VPGGEQMNKRISEDRAESVFEDYKQEYTPEQAVIEANRCLFCSDAPCMKACPTHIDVAQFIKIATGNGRRGAHDLRRNILGMSCSRL
jgi:glutamate synthase (NADPH/NADH) small chain